MELTGTLAAHVDRAAAREVAEDGLHEDVLCRTLEGTICQEFCSTTLL